MIGRCGCFCRNFLHIDDMHRYHFCGSLVARARYPSTGGILAVLVGRSKARAKYGDDYCGERHKNEQIPLELSSHKATILLLYAKQNVGIMLCANKYFAQKTKNEPVHCVERSSHLAFQALFSV